MDKDLVELEQLRSVDREEATSRIDNVFQLVQDNTDNLIAVQQLRGCYEKLTDKSAHQFHIEQQ